MFHHLSTTLSAVLNGDSCDMSLLIKLKLWPHVSLKCKLQIEQVAAAATDRGETYAYDPQTRKRRRSIVRQSELWWINKTIFGRHGAAMKALGGQYQGAATQILAAEANYVVSNHQVEEH